MIYASGYTQGNHLSLVFHISTGLVDFFKICNLFLEFRIVYNCLCVCGPNAVCYPPGCVYSLGRAEYGRLGLGQGAEEKIDPTPVLGLGPSTRVACGASVSYAITKEGERHCKYT